MGVHWGQSDLLGEWFYGVDGEKKMKNAEQRTRVGCR